MTISLFNIFLGYFRVNYDDENWKRIVEYMNSDNYENIHVNNRAQIINDLFTFAKEEPLMYGKHFWQLTKYLSRETEYIPWEAALTALRSIDGVFGDISVRGTLQVGTFNDHCYDDLVFIHQINVDLITLNFATLESSEK